MNKFRIKQYRIGKERVFEDCKKVRLIEFQNQIVTTLITIQNEDVTEL